MVEEKELSMREKERFARNADSAEGCVQRRHWSATAAHLILSPTNYLNGGSYDWLQPATALPSAFNVRQPCAHHREHSRDWHMS